MTSELIMEILEATMVLCFGISWPLSILKVSDGRSFSLRTTLTRLPLPLMFKDPMVTLGPPR